MNQLLGCLSWRTVAACSPSSTVELPTGLLPNQPAKPGLPAGLYFSSGKYESGNMNINSSPKNASTQLSQCFACTLTHTVLTISQMRKITGTFILSYLLLLLTFTSLSESDKFYCSNEA